MNKFDTFVAKAFGFVIAPVFTLLLFLGFLVGSEPTWGELAMGLVFLSPVVLITLAVLIWQVTRR
jgi:hypothetical protein